MNLRGKTSRIQQAAMLSASPRRSVPASVEIVNGADAYLTQSIPSQPIPIKKFRPSARELEEDATSTNSSTHYEWATWRMYDRITSARRLRAFSRSSHHVQPMCIDEDAYGHLYRVEPIMSNIPHHRQPSAVEELGDDGVFVFDAL